MKCSICGSLPAWWVDKDDKGTYWLCGECATEQVMETFLEKQILVRVARAAKEWHDVRQSKGSGTWAEFTAFCRFAGALKEVEHLL